MASAVNEADLTDVEWLVMRARSFPKTDPYTSKAWLITAKCLFPQSFIVQFESYLVEKNAKNVEEAGRQLQEMLQNFSQEPKLWEEVHCILESLHKDSHDHKSVFLTDLFSAIPTSLQCLMLLRVSEKIENVYERCQLLLLAMKKFPNLVQEHGLNLVNMLVKEETNSGTLDNPVNSYRRLLVCDVMPLVLQKSEHLEVNMFQLCLWLQRAIEFYVSYVSQPSSSNSGESSESDNKSKSYTASESNIQVQDPWGNLMRLLLLIGQRLNWDFEKGLLSKPIQYQINSLLTFLWRPPTSEVNGKQVLHTAMVLFTYSLVGYITQINPSFSSNSLNSPIVIVDALPSHKIDIVCPPRTKKAKVENHSIPTVLHTASISAFPNILQMFETAVKCFEILNSTDAMRFEFLTFCQNWKEETQTMLQIFQADILIYRGKHSDAISLLNTLLPTSQGKLKKRMLAQFASSLFSSKKYSESCKVVMDIIENSSSIETNSLNFLSADVKGDQHLTNYLSMFPCGEAEIVSYSLQLLTAALHQQITSSKRTDVCLAYLLILLQCQWPQQENIFSQVIDVIQKQGSFTYNEFFSYIHEVDILEEFAFLDTPEGGKVNLDIMPVSTKAIAQQRTVTRGVNKGVKEDFKAALEKQAGLVREPNSVLIKKFLQEEKDGILNCFA